MTSLNGFKISFKKVICIRSQSFSIRKQNVLLPDLAVAVHHVHIITEKGLYTEECLESLSVMHDVSICFPVFVSLNSSTSRNVLWTVHSLRQHTDHSY